MHEIIKDLNWRYAIKKYDSSKKIQAEDIEILKEAVSLSPSSLGLQPYKILIIENKGLREKLKEKSQGQAQITDASHLFVFCSLSQISEIYVDSYIKQVAKRRNSIPSDLKLYRDSLWNSVSKMKLEKESTYWAAKQAYLGLGNLLHTAARLQIDATPMEGFDPAGYDDILNLSEKGLTASVLCALGYRSEDDKYQHLIKVRKEKKYLFEIL